MALLWRAQQCRSVARKQVSRHNEEEGLRQPWRSHLVKVEGVASCEELIRKPQVSSAQERCLMGTFSVRKPQ